ncbi:5-bromo-4-chloroindolyl phosphate hydrolysis family protein [Salinicoccus carnicancri]|uniref:5-bromo-4-chloroindolyl phosphate hydrolysis family protein n=1 Tax=Salinicoccus carnicancri TaxID=558170 RepID=UPI0002F6D6F6|nr:5-bromo-4-chloroindolyl phosphate hydrolysis family protein [Salinicoccus carnicancri]
MKYNISHWFASMVSIPAAIIAGLASMIAFDIHLVYDMLIAAGGFFAAYFPSQSYSMKSQLREMGITKSEYKYVKTKLGEAREKIRRLRKNYKNVRTLKDAKLIYDINRIVRTIYSSVEDNPKLFFGVQQFFHSNLDSAVNTIEQYLYLYKMPGKSKEEKVKLHETRISLLELKRTLQSNLSAMNRSTYHSLDVEKEVIKLNRKRSGGPLRLDNELDRQKVNMDKKEKEPAKADRGEKNEGRK